MAASGEPAAEIKAVTSSGLDESCETRYVLLPLVTFCDAEVDDNEDTVESIDGLRGIIVDWLVRVVLGGFEKELILGDIGGDMLGAAVNSGADTLRCTCGWLLLVVFSACSLNASRVTALRKSSNAGSPGTRLAGFGARGALVCCAEPAARGAALVLKFARELVGE